MPITFPLTFIGYQIIVYFYFFFQAEDGIRDYKVTGVQTCALPILALRQVDDAFGGCRINRRVEKYAIEAFVSGLKAVDLRPEISGLKVFLIDRKRSEERRVGEECRSRWSPYHLKKKKKRNS